MGKRGPRPKPTALKELEGTARKDRAVANEPRPKVRVPDAPSWLGTDAKREWRRVTKELLAVRMVTHLDRTALALYCQALQEYLDASDALDSRDGDLLAYSAQDTPLIHPLVSIRNEAWKRVLRAAAEFGMTPSSRSRISVPVDGPEEKSNPFLKLMA